MEKLKVGDEVVYKGILNSYKAKIFGIAEKSDFKNKKYAISFVDNKGDLINGVVKGDDLSTLEESNLAKIKGKY